MVAVLPDQRLYFSLSVPLLPALLRDQVDDHRRRLHHPLLWLHGNYGLFVLPDDRHSRIFRLLLVHQENIQRREG